MIFEKWLFVYEEWMLKEIIEWMTNRSSSIMLPEDFNFLQYPEASYSIISEIWVNTHMNLELETWEDIYKFLKDIANEWNSINTNLKNELHEFKSWAQQQIDGEIKSIQKSIDNKVKDTQDDIDDSLNFDKQSYKPDFENLNFIKNSLIWYRADTSKLNISNLLVLQDSVLNSLEIWKSNLISNKDDNYKHEISKNVADINLKWDKTSFLTNKMTKTHVKSLKSQLRWFGWNRVPQPVELNQGLWFAYGIWVSVFFKEFHWINRDLVWSEVQVMWFDSIDIQRRAVNLFRSEIIWNELIVEWKNEDDISSYIIEVKDKINWYDHSMEDFTQSLIYVIYKWEIPEWLVQTLQDKPWALVKIEKYEDSQLRIKLDRNWYFAKINWVIWNDVIWTSSVNRILSAKDVQTISIINSDKKEKRLIPVLIDNVISIWSDDEVVSWDIDWDWIFESIWNDIVIPARQRLESFNVTASIIDFSIWINLIQEVEIEVFSPDISLLTHYHDKIVWTIYPIYDNYPVSLLISDNDDFSIYWETFYTDENWRFEIDRDDIKNYKNIYDSSWDSIAKIDLINKKIIPEPWYHLEFFASEDWKFSRISIMKWNEIQINIFTLVKDAALEEVDWDLDLKNESSKIFIKDVNQDDDIDLAILKWIQNYNWAMVINKNWIELALISNKWEVILYNWANVRIKQWADSSFVFEVLFNWIVIFEFYIWVKLEEDGAISSNNIIPNFKAWDMKVVKFDWKLSPVYLASLEKTKAEVKSSEITTVDQIKQFSNEWILPFWDVASDHPARDAILELYRRNIIEWYTDKTFRPWRKISRAEFVKIVLWATDCRDCTRPTREDKQGFLRKPFPDVNLYDWFFFCISKAKKLSMVTWYLSDGLFRPHKNISRWEAVAILLRQSDIKIDKFRNTIKDVKNEHWFKDYIQTAVDIWLIFEEDSYVSPLEEITRWEFTLITTRLLSLQDCQMNDKNKNQIPDYLEFENWTWENKWAKASIYNFLAKIWKSTDFYERLQGSPKFLNNLLQYYDDYLNDEITKESFVNYIDQLDIILPNFSDFPETDVSIYPDDGDMLFPPYTYDDSSLAQDLYDDPLLTPDSDDDDPSLTPDPDDFVPSYPVITDLPDPQTSDPDPYPFEPVACVFIEDVSNLWSWDWNIKIFWIIVSEDRQLIFSKSRESVK